jgi:DNA-binding MarR family transcriptional regulator
MTELTQAGAELSELVLEVFRLNRLLLDAGDELTRPAGLTSARWQVLGVVEHGPTPVAHVARTMGLTRQNVQQIADSLVADGLAAYQENPHHRRAKLIALTPRGRTALDAVQRSHAIWANQLGEQPAFARVAQLVDELRAIRTCLEDSAHPPASPGA